MQRHHAAALLTLATLAACASSPSPASPTDAGSLADALAPDAPLVLDVASADAPNSKDAPDVASPAEDAPATAGAYPEGPYGNREGDVLADLAWQGYVNESGEEVSTALPFVDTSLQALRGSGRGYALIQVSEFL